jgi:hypothetical protein
MLSALLCGARSGNILAPMNFRTVARFMDRALEMPRSEM